MSSYKHIFKKIPYPPSVSRRFKELDALERLLTGDFYDHLPYEWNQERSGSKAVKLSERKPGATYNLAELIVNDVVSLLFTEEHSPYAACWNGEGDSNPFEGTENVIETLREEYLLDAVMLEAAYEGSVGSVAIVVRELEDQGKVWLEVVKGKQVIPHYNIKNPTKLDSLERLYPIKGQDLVDQGYPGGGDQDPDSDKIKESKTYFMRIELDDKEEVWYHPMIEDEYNKIVNNLESKPVWVRDDERSWAHTFGVCPAIFIRNTVHSKNGVDGEATFGKVVDLIVEMDYLISQIGRGFRANLDPLLKINLGELGNIAPMADGGSLTGEVDETGRVTPGTDGAIRDLADRNILPLSGKDAGAEFLQIDAQSYREGREWLGKVREWALEIVGGMKSDQEHSGGQQSGKALEILHKKLIWLIDRMRICYGARGYVPLLKLMLLGMSKGIIVLDNPPAKSDLNINAPIRLTWPKWNMPDGAELLDIVSAFELAAGGSQNAPVPLMADEIAARFIAMYSGETDPKRAVAKWMADRKGQLSRIEELTKATTPPPPPKPPGSGPPK